VSQIDVWGLRFKSNESYRCEYDSLYFKTATYVNDSLIRCPIPDVGYAKDKLIMIAVYFWTYKIEEFKF